jgi:hypothetical protein
MRRKGTGVATKKLTEKHYYKKAIDNYSGAPALKDKLAFWWF